MNLKETPKVKAGYVVVKEVPESEDDNKTKAGIILTDTNKMISLFKRAEVVEVGADPKYYSMECRVGDIVMVNKNKMEMTDRTFKVNGDPRFLLWEESDVFAWISREDGGYFIPDNETQS